MHLGLSMPELMNSIVCLDFGAYFTIKKLQGISHWSIRSFFTSSAGRIDASFPFLEAFRIRPISGEFENESLQFTSMEFSLYLPI